MLNAKFHKVFIKVKSNTLTYILKGIKGEESALNLKKNILRYAALSYTLLMSSISEPMEQKYMNINRPDILIEKNLVTKEEIESLKDDKVCTI